MDKGKIYQKEKLKRQIMIRITESQFEKLSKESFDRDLAVSQIIREAIKSGRPDIFTRCVVGNEETE